MQMLKVFSFIAYSIKSLPSEPCLLVHQSARLPNTFLTANVSVPLSEGSRGRYPLHTAYVHDFLATLPETFLDQCLTSSFPRTAQGMPKQCT